jgi:putative ABC transport system permease protein
MNAYMRLAVAGLFRSPGRTAVRTLVLAAAVALLAAMLLFVGDSLSTMTSAATRTVPLDWQGPVASQAQAIKVAQGVAAQPGVQQASAVATAPFAGMSHKAGTGTIDTSSGAILAVPPGYLQHLQTFRYLHGSLQPGGIVLDQQLAATLQATVGDYVTLTPTKGAAPLPFKVTGVVLVSAGDVLFQPLNPLLGPAPAQPPANVVVMPLDTFAKTVAPALPTTGASNAASAAVPGTLPGTQWQVQVQVDPTHLGSSPSAALKTADQTRNRIERMLPGQVRFVDNLSDALNGAAGDALYAQTLYIMLAVPGALIALGLAYLAALGTVEADRRDLALLRARGATRRGLLALAAAESLVIGIVAGLLGVAAGAAAVTAVVPGGLHVTALRGLWIVLASVGLGFAGAAAARIGASIAAFRGTVGDARRATRRQGAPLWQRLYLDVLALVASGLIYWLTARTGFSAVVNPDSNPTLSLSVYMFFGPALLWIGATLLLVRLRGGVVSWLARRASPGRATTMRGFLLASAGRRGAAINRGLVVVGLLLAFGVNLGIFTATYNQQALVDAQLTLGADVVATAPPGVTASQNLAGKVAQVPGVTAATAVDHSYAYVGPDLQDTYGIDSSTFTRATTLRDSYFVGGTAAQTMARLKTTPDGILVSKETVTDYQLKMGDLLRLRVLDHATGKFVVAPFHVVGIVLEFPSAPKDSFMVTNLPYLLSVTHDPGATTVFAAASGDTKMVAARVAQATAADGTTVKDISSQVAATVSSITTVDLTGISRIEEVFVVVLAAAAMALFVTLAMGERRREFAVMAAVSATRREIAAFIWSEAALILAVGMVLAVGLGWLLSVLLVAMLKHVFDPPPDALAVPWLFLGVLAGAAVVGAAASMALAARGLRRMPLGSILREQ